MVDFQVCNGGFNKTKNWEPGCWVEVTEPSHKELVEIQAKYDVPLEFIKDIEDVEERPRIEVEEGWLMIILRIPYKREESNSPFGTVPFGILMKNDIFLTICHYNTEMASDFKKYTIRKNIKEKKGIDLVLSLFLSSSVWYLKYLKQMNSQIKGAENQLEESIRNEELHQLMRFEKCLVYFITSLRGNEVVMARLKKYLRTSNDEFDDDLLDEVEIEAQQAYTTANIYSDILAGTMDAYASIISNNLNVIMKQLTSVSIILMIPTLVASLYGMNVPNNLESNQWGFWIVILVSFLMSLLGIWIFYRRKFF
ncbi:MAG: magnesium transporter CorA family protein [Bacteroidales bacterium]|nr:magnesium transporter CorA family protein [Bacteroidales bacterium]